MSIQTCPTTMVQAPAERVWRLLTAPSAFQWTGLKVVQAPDRPMAAGDQIVLCAGAGPGRLLEMRFRVIDLERCRRLALEVHLPFGIVNHEVVVINPASDAACRVTYN